MNEATEKHILYLIQCNWSARLYVKIKTEHKILSFQAICKYGWEACLWEPSNLLQSYTQASTQVKQGWARWLNIFCNFAARLCNWEVVNPILLLLLLPSGFSSFLAQCRFQNNIKCFLVKKSKSFIISHAQMERRFCVFIYLLAILDMKPVSSQKLCHALGQSLKTDISFFFFFSFLPHINRPDGWPRNYGIPANCMLN